MSLPARDRVTVRIGRLLEHQARGLFATCGHHGCPRPIEPRDPPASGPNFCGRPFGLQLHFSLRAGFKLVGSRPRNERRLPADTAQIGDERPLLRIRELQIAHFRHVARGGLQPVLGHVSKTRVKIFTGLTVATRALTLPKLHRLGLDWLPRRWSMAIRAESRRRQDDERREQDHSVSHAILRMA